MIQPEKWVTYVCIFSFAQSNTKHLYVFVFFFVLANTYYSIVFYCLKVNSKRICHCYSAEYCGHSECWRSYLLIATKYTFRQPLTSERMKETTVLHMNNRQRWVGVGDCNASSSRWQSYLLSMASDPLGLSHPCYATGHTAFCLSHVMRTIWHTCGSKSIYHLLFPIDCV